MSGCADEIFAVDRVSLRDGNKLISIGRIIKFVQRVRKAHFDFVIDLHSLSETNLLGFVSGAPHRLYSRRPGRSIDILSNFSPRPPLESQGSHIIDRYLAVLEPLGITNAPRTPWIKTTRTADAAVETLLKKEKAQSGSLLVGIFPGAGNVSRRWPLENFAELADFLIRNDRVRIIVFAGPEESKILADMKKIFPPTTIFFTRLSIAQLASAAARLTMFISNDTGPMHIAAAVGTSVITIMDRPTLHGYITIGDQHRQILGKTI